MDKELAQAAAALMKDPAKREEFAQMFIEFIDPTHIATDMVGMLLNTRSLQPGDSLVKKVRKGIKVHSFVPGQVPMSSEMTVSERMNYILDAAVVGVTANEWELNSGEIGTLESLRGEMEANLRDYYINKVFTALSTIWSASNTALNFTSVGGNVTKTALDNMIQQINKTTSGVKAIVGTRANLYPIMSFAGWDTLSSTNVPIASVREEIFRTGWLGQYGGAPLVVVNQQYNNPEDYAALIPEDKILVIGENVGEFITFGQPNFNQYVDQKPIPPQYYLRLWQQFGFLVTEASGIGVLQVA